MNALPKPIAEDVNLDGVVDVEDLVTVASRFGKPVTKGTYPNPDVNSDGVVNRQDVLRVITLLEAAGAHRYLHRRRPCSPQITFNTG